MSLLSRISAPATQNQLAELVGGLLSTVDNAPEFPVPPRSLPGPTGLGTAVTRIRPRPRPAQPAQPSRPDGTPELYCPAPIRDDPVLGDAVNERLIAWAEQVEIYPGRLDRLQAANFGRLVMLTHPDTDDPDRLLAAAKCATAEWAVDDYYCDDESAGAAPELLGPRLALATIALDPDHLPHRYAPDLERAMRAEPVLVALRSAVEHLSRYATPVQVSRLSYEISELFVGFGAEAGWRTAGRTPPVWEYLAARQLNSFLPCITVTDVVGGYQVPAEEYTAAPVRRAVKAAALAATLVNDLYSMTKSGSGADFQLPAMIAAEERCSLDEGVRRSVEIHDELVRAYESEAAALSLTGSPALRRFLAGVWAWLGGNREWHSSSDRYRH